MGGPRAERLVALLALRAGSPVRTDALIDELWAGEPPDGAPTTLRSYVSLLRSALGHATPIERTSAGYALHFPSEFVDMTRFERFVREGRELLDRGRHRRAGEVLRRALELWRGRPFAGLVEHGTLLAEAVRLEELRLHALESRFEADLELGRSAEIVDELEALVAEHPFRERLWRHLMLALYRAGRQADALAAYHRARAALDEQLGIEPSEDLRDLEAAILRQEVPLPHADDRPVIGFPFSLTNFVGRTRELEDVRALLGRARLVTLVGVGGVGKTRLAIEVARCAIDDLADGAAFVDLAALSDPTALSDHVAAALGLGEASGASLAAAISERFPTTDLLVVLDNCEHLREATAALAQAVLETSPDLRILATSRAVLDVPGEAPYPVPPLGLPGEDHDLEAIRNSDAVRLLVDRATLTRHDLRVDDAALDTAERICRELEGLPLAIELAAARTKALSLDEIAERLGDRFRFLVAGRRLTAARHRTLREAMDWSFELLAPDEQRLLARLSVFPAGATLESIAAVCLDGDGDEAERLIEGLVDASLLVPSLGNNGTRYRLLETVRQYAAERLPEADRDELERRHAERARAIAEATHLSVEGTDFAMSFDLARDELPSIRAAIQWAGGADPGLGLEIACALERYWASRLAREGVATFTSLLEHDGIPDALRARALRCLGGCRTLLGDFGQGATEYEEALAIHRRLRQPAYEAHILLRLAIEAYRIHDRQRTRELLDEAAAAGGDDRYAPDRYSGLALSAHLAFDAGRNDEGFELLGRAVELARAADDDWWQIHFLMQLSERARDLGLLDAVGPAAREALRKAMTIEDRRLIIYGLWLLAQDAATAGLGHRAGRIWGGIEAEVARGGPVGQWEVEAESLRTQVEDTAGAGFEAAVAEGRSLSLDAVVDEALSPP